MSNSLTLIQGREPRDEQSAVATLIVELLRAVGTPLFRRFIQSTMTFQYGCDPTVVPKSLKVLVSGALGSGYGRVFLTKVPVPGRKWPTQAYSYGRPPSENEIQELRHLEELHRKLLPHWLLRRAGEEYVRGLLLQAGYVSVTQRKHLGYVTGNGKHSLDVAATDPISGTRFGISVKNQNEWLTAKSRAIKDCYARCREQNLAPWLFIPFATGKAEMRCHYDGIRLTVLGRQIVPVRDRWGRPMHRHLPRIRQIVGPQPYEYLMRRFDRTLSRSPSVARDVEKIQDNRLRDLLGERSRNVEERKLMRLSKLLHRIKSPVRAEKRMALLIK